MPSRGEEPQEAQARQIRERKYFDRWDLAAVLALTIVAFVLRFFSPTLPDFFVHPFQGPWIRDWVNSRPIDPQGDLGTLCGLALPSTRAAPGRRGGSSRPTCRLWGEGI